MSAKQKTDSLLVLINEIEKSLNQETKFIIGIDGCFLSGKTTLANKISNFTNLPTIDLDKYIIKNELGVIAEYIRYDELKNDIQDILTSSCVIFSGALLLKILHKMNLRSPFLIYVTRCDSYGNWYDKDDCEMKGDVRSTIAASIKRYKALGVLDEQKHYNREGEIELIEYHQKYTPQLKANYIYLRKEYDSNEVE